MMDLLQVKMDFMNDKLIEKFDKPPTNFSIRPP